jgi:hypothetical protein
MNAQVPEPILAIIGRLKQSVEEVLLPRAVRLNIVTLVRCSLIPPSKPGRKNPAIDAAWPEYERGVRGIRLFRHIQGHSDMNQYHRRAVENRLLDGLRKRAARAAAKTR